MTTAHDLSFAKLNEPGEIKLSDYAGKAVLIVNVASACGFTSQYRDLEALYEAKAGKGLVIIGVPCNDFGGQEPGPEKEIREFCDSKYHVTFPMSAKLEVNGPDRHQLYTLLAGEGAEFPGDITWNFEKLLLGPDGRVLARFSPRTAPDDAALLQAIEGALDKL